MKKLFLVMLAATFVTACANKDIYFNGSEGSNSGLKYDHNTDSLSINK
ncbi:MULTISPECIES: hypothetical protein [Basfia]|uniref:Lipoprotein n=2 Tax=Basfia TaxID=697331 RepID=Q65TH7_MANSM|nr:MULTISPECIES: hypothetical protein [Basfia]AAU37733.1 unknown [[Mannheimia] succiniciproducens MBEL55E]SCX75603.1 hypothetical protein SAMN02910354_00151 [Basfia succiniciproducens]SEP76224.1 hypothetical protein SAMN02910415_00407 [Basfia succiniciproducens]